MHLPFHHDNHDTEARAMLVLLHPVGLDHDCWQFTGLDAATPDYPGHGGREFDPDTYTLEEIADEIVASYDGPLDVVGVSMGSHVGQYIAVRHPDRVRSLMLCCSGLGGTPETAAAATQDARADDTRRLGMDGMMDTTLTRWFTPEALADPEHPGVAYARRRLLADDPEVVATTWLLLKKNAVARELAHVRVPTTVLGGRWDSAGTPERVTELFSAIPGSRLEIIDGPHMLQLERPRQFADAVARHLAWAEGTVSTT